MSRPRERESSYTASAVVDLVHDLTEADKATAPLLDLTDEVVADAAFFSALAGDACAESSCSESEEPRLWPVLPGILSLTTPDASQCAFPDARVVGCNLGIASHSLGSLPHVLTCVEAWHVLHSLPVVDMQQVQEGRGSHISMFDNYRG